MESARRRGSAGVGFRIRWARARVMTVSVAQVSKRKVVGVPRPVGKPMPMNGPLVPVMTWAASEGRRLSRGRRLWVVAVGSVRVGLVVMEHVKPRRTSWSEDKMLDGPLMTEAGRSMRFSIEGE